MTNFDKKKTSCNIFCFCLNEETDDTADCNSPIQEKLSSVHNFQKNNYQHRFDLPYIAIFGATLQTQYRKTNEVNNNSP